MAPATNHSRDQNLCRVCQKFDFDRYRSNKLENPTNLGRWADILLKQNCRFCRLVTKCLKSKNDLKPTDPDSEVFLDNEPSWELGIEFSPYDRTNSESYSNKFDLRSRAKQSDETAYRYVVSTAASDRKGFIQYLARVDDDSESRQFFGRRVLQDKVDIDLLRFWLRLCRKRHGLGIVECDRVGVAGGDLPENIRFIDVIERCIVRAPTSNGLQYVALSYVWGTEQMKRLTGMEPAILQRNDIKLVQGREMTPLPRKLPQTIEDAIWLAKELGFRYLWNDALCIVQNDPDQQKDLHLSRMHATYSCASLTIAAAAGNHADYGLPGISTPRRYLQHSERIRSRRLATMFPSYSELENSTLLFWNTRGWTLQEKLLSNRILLFTDFQVYFKCSESIWTEEVCMETGRLSKSAETRVGKYRWGPDRKIHHVDERNLLKGALNRNLHIIDDWEYMHGFLAYVAMVHEYTKRTLTDPKDVLFAVKGILNVLQPSHARLPFIFGLPQAHFLESLLWFPETGAIQRRTSAGGMPSWSWASWSFGKRSASYEVEGIHEFLKALHATTTMIEAESLICVEGWNCIVRCLEPLLRLRSYTPQRVYYIKDGWEQVIEFADPMSPLFDSHAGILSKGRMWWKRLTKLHDPRSLLEEIERYSTKSTDSWKPSRRDTRDEQPSLVFKTSIVQLHIGRTLHGQRHDSEDEAGHFELLNSDGACIGELWTTFGVVRRAGNAPVDFLAVSGSFALKDASIHPDFTPKWSAKLFPEVEDEAIEEDLAGATVLGDGMLVFIEKVAQDMGQNFKFPEKWKSGSKAADSSLAFGRKLYKIIATANIGEPLPRFLWPVVNLICVAWDGSTANRLGVGKVIIDAWEQVKTPAREVVLV